MLLAPRSGSQPLAAYCAAGDQDDIVLQSFKQQQKAYRALLEGLKVSAGVQACPQPSELEDLVDLPTLDRGKDVDLA